MFVLKYFKNTPRSPPHRATGTKCNFFSLNLQRGPWQKKRKEKKRACRPPNGRQGPVAHPRGGRACRRLGRRQVPFPLCVLRLAPIPCTVKNRSPAPRQMPACLHAVSSLLSSLDPLADGMTEAGHATCLLLALLRPSWRPDRPVCCTQEFTLYSFLF